MENFLDSLEHLQQSPTSTVLLSPNTVNSSLPLTPCNRPVVYKQNIIALTIFNVVVFLVGDCILTQSLNSLCGLGIVAESLWASVSSYIKWEYKCLH